MSPDRAELQARACFNRLLYIALPVSETIRTPNVVIMGAGQHPVTACRTGLNSGTHHAVRDTCTTTPLTRHRQKYAIHGVIITRMHIHTNMNVTLEPNVHSHSRSAPAKVQGTMRFRQPFI